MKTSYLKHISVLCLLTILSLSSCLKDDRYFNPAATASYVAEFPLGGIANFSADAITDAGPTITRQFVIDIASINAPTTATSVTIGVDNSLIAPYNTAYTAVTYNPMPTGSYTFPDMVVTIPAGQRQATISVTFDKSKLDPSLSYMLPISIKSAPGITISGNYGVHYYHFIGNDFAGVYKYDYSRYNNGVGPTGGSPSTFTPGQSTTLLPVTPTQFEATTSYVGAVKYEVTFTKTGSGSSATYSNFAVTFDPATVASIWTAGGITIVQQPKILVADPVNKIFEFYYIVNNGTANRYIDDKYYK